MVNTALSSKTHRTSETEPFQRNRYFYGKMLDVLQFEMETGYFNAKRWMLNHIVLGYGVVCGLNVLPGESPTEIQITPGIAIDKWGREIIVPTKQTYSIPPDVIQLAYSQCKKEETATVQVLLCYHECAADPVPVLAGECDNSRACEPGTIRESYRIEFEQGACAAVPTECKLETFIVNGAINYPSLVEWVTDRPCASVAKDPCIPLANIKLSAKGNGKGDVKPPVITGEDIDINIRRIVMTNRLLADLLPCLVKQNSDNSEEQD